MLPESIQIHSDPAHLLRTFLEKKTYSQVAILADHHTNRFCYPLVVASLPQHHLVLVEAGEEHKNLDTCRAVWQKLTEHELDRHALLIVLGGGVLGDLGGFCAATYKRGIDFLLVPTTLLSQVDASVGGKLGIDFNGFKNHIGIFQEPKATLISEMFLKTLPERELRSGFAEVIKHCLISDRKMWEKIKEKDLKNQDWPGLIHHSVVFKSAVVREDPREAGRRKILNFGHTIGHALETHFLNTPKRLFHGEAIAAGMIAEGFIARQKQLISKQEEAQIRSYIIGIFGKTATGEKEQIIGIIRQDKKNKGKKILMALPKGIGSATWDIEVTEELIMESLACLDAQ